MIATNERIIVSVNMAQKNEMVVGGVVFKTAMKYEINYREKSPVVAKVVSGNNILKEGDILLNHHNHYFGNSPYFMYDDLYSIPFNKTIFAKLKPDGTLHPVCGNVLGNRVDIQTALVVAAEERKKYKDRLHVTHGGDTKFRPDDLILTRPSAPYEIVYFVDKIEYRICKVSEDMIVGVEKKYFVKAKNP